MEPKIEVKILKEIDSSDLQVTAQKALDEGWRPIGGPYPENGGVAWAFIKIPPPPPKPEQPPPTTEELIAAATEGRTIVREG